MITVQIPKSYEPERRYILSVLFGEFLGLDIWIQAADRGDVKITAGNGRKLLVADQLFGMPEDQWLRPGSLPCQPLKTWNLATAAITATTTSQFIPVIYGIDPDSSNFFTISKDQIGLGLDIFGTAFFMLTRYEEVIKPDRDEYDRFPASASLAYQEGFLDRPIVNEYLEILWACLKHLWPKLQRKPRRFRVSLSHDVDWPLLTAGQTLPQVLRAAVGDVVRRKDPLLTMQRIRSFSQTQQGRLDCDMGNTFNFIIKLSEQRDLRSAFYFIALHTAEAIDGLYSIEDAWIRKLLRDIYERGHEIGLHPSYHTFRNSLQTQREFKTLLRVCEEEDIH